MEQNDHSLDNTPLLRAIARMQTENSRESREAVLDLIISQASFWPRRTSSPRQRERRPPCAFSC